MGSTIREALESAFDASEGASSSAPAGEAAPVEDSSSAAPAAEGPSSSAPEVDASSSETPAAPKARDESGRFAKGPKPPPRPTAPKPAPAPVSAAPAAAAVPAPSGSSDALKAPEVLRAPQSWTPAEREFFGKLPLEAQRAIQRQDVEVQKVLRESAPARKFHEAFNRLTTPYAPLLAGTEPLQAIGGMLQTVATLATGSAPQKAGLLANLIKSYGVDINALAAALDGQPAAPGAQTAPMDAQAIYSQVRQQLLQDFTQQARTQQARTADAEVAAFAQGHEFLDDVAEDMAALMDAAQRRGVALGYEEAYTRACRAHPEVSKVVAQREAAAAATAAQAATQRARAAASSVRTQPATTPANGAERRSVRETLENVASQLSGR